MRFLKRDSLVPFNEAARHRQYLGFGSQTTGSLDGSGGGVRRRCNRPSTHASRGHLDRRHRVHREICPSCMSIATAASFANRAARERSGRWLVNARGLGPPSPCNRPSTQPRRSPLLPTSVPAHVVATQGPLKTARVAARHPSMMTGRLSGRLHYSDVIRPSEWKFTKRDLNALLERIAAHEDAALTARITAPTNTSPKIHARPLSTTWWS